MASGATHACPVCRAAFRGAARCSRCGADLTRAMLLVLHAQRLRNCARAAVRSGDTARAAGLAEFAQSLCPGKEGRALLVLARWLEARTRPTFRH